MARLVTIAVSIFLIFTFLLLALMEKEKDAWIAVAVLALSFIVFVFSIYKATSRMQSELVIIADYLKNLENVDKIEYKTHFFTKEFEDINQNLIKVLESAKKREEIKQRYNAKLKLKNRQRGDMISAIAHEFRNPIASIMGYSQTLTEDPDIPKPLQDKFLTKIYNNGNKIEALLSRLILWNKFESGEATLHKSTFDLYALSEEVKRAVDEKYKHRTIILEGQSCRVEADRTLIDVVLKNLIENALKYSKEDVYVTVEEGRVQVQDKGVGIGEKDVSNVTKKFYRSGTHNWDNSMGLGLSIVKTILSMHQTRLEISSEIGVGSTFAFQL